MAHRPKKYAARFKFNRINELNAISDKGGEYGINARAAKKAMTQSWSKRTMSSGTMHKSKNNKRQPVIEVRV